MNGCIQQADFSCTDIVASDVEEAVAAWEALDKPAADALLQTLKAQGQEFCSWGISFTNDKGVQVHVFRARIEDDAYAAIVDRDDVVNQFEGVSAQFAEETIRTFFVNWRALLPDAE